MRRFRSGRALAVGLALAAACVRAGPARPRAVASIEPLEGERPIVVTRTAAGGTVVTVAIDPAPYAMPLVRWVADGGAIALEPRTAPLGSVTVVPLRTGGAALTALVGPPVNRRLDVPVWAYAPVDPRASAALRLLADGTLAPSAPAGGDLVRTASGYRTPFGGAAVALAAPTALAFARATPAAPAAASREIAASATALVLRARDGRLVKLGLDGPAAGAYAVARSDGTFDDAAFANADAAAAQATRRLPDAVRIPGPTAPPALAPSEQARLARRLRAAPA